MLRTHQSLAALLVCAVASGYAGAQSRTPKSPNVDFDSAVRPLLMERCFKCHGPDASKRQANLRLDMRAGVARAASSGRKLVNTSKPDLSEMLIRVASNGAERMPPEGGGKPLTLKEQALLRAWISQGAVYKPHWSFTALNRPAVPKLDKSGQVWARNSVDAFVYAKLRSMQLKPSPEADRRTLIRRLSFDLTGLPPSSAEVDGFLKDARPRAYERVVDQLLASPRYGERWARHWLDVVHYGDTQGYDKDKRRPNAWPYRDYVIQSLNADKPYSRFVQEQLAGDVLWRDDPAALIATGFISAGPWDFVGQVELREGTLDKKITRVLDRDDMVVNAMGTFVGLTAHCARCHDHKFDPIKQTDYYGLAAVFAGVDRADRLYDANPDIAAMRRNTAQRLRLAQSRVLELERDWHSATASAGKAVAVSAAAAAEALPTLPPGSAEASPSNGYHSQVSSTPQSAKWVQIDLGSVKPVDYVVLLPARPTDFPDRPGFGFPEMFRVELSDEPTFANARALTTEARIPLPSPGDRPWAISATGMHARYVRVTASRLAERTSDFIFALSELQIYSNGSNAAAGATVLAMDTIESGRWSSKYLTDGFTSRAIAPTYDAPTLASAAKASAAVLEVVAAADRKLDEGATRDEWRALQQGRSSVQSLQTQLATLPKQSKTFAGTSEFSAEGSFTPTNGTPRLVEVLNRGSVEQPLGAATPGAVTLVPGLGGELKIDPALNEGGRRASFAAWVTDRRNSLTWRSIVNRVWHYHFGRGIVETPNDFGRMGALPTHPELLDWLAVEFRDTGQSLKSLHRLMVTSATYRQRSDDGTLGARLDAGNRFLWRMNRTRLDAESIRDAVLAVTGLLDLKMGGPGYDLFGFEDDHSPRYKYETQDPDDPKTLRRSIYRFIVRSAPDPFMETLDCADASQNVPVRNTTITALQALALLNNRFMVRQAERFAERVSRFGDSRAKQIAAAFRLALARPPTAPETSALVKLAERDGLAAACRIILNLNEFVFVD